MVGQARAALGEAAGVVLASQHVVPARAVEEGYRLLPDDEEGLRKAG